MRVVQIAPEIAPGSGVGGVAHHLERGLSALGVDVTRFTLADARGGWLPEPGPGLRGKLALLARVVWFSTVGTILAKRALRSAPDAVSICHNDVLAGDVYVNHGILRVAMKARGSYAFRMLRNPLHLFTSARDAIRYGSRTHRVVVSLTSSEAELLAGVYPRLKAESVVISNGVDVQRFTPPTASERAAARRDVLPASVPADARCLLFVGHEYDRKGLPLIIEALCDLPAHVHLLVVGGTAEMVVGASGLAAGLGVSSRVHLAGRMPDPLPAYHAADCFVLPSAYEANALVILEAFACGLPVIATPVGYAPDVVENGGNGFIVERTATSVRDGINAYLAAEPALLSAAARASAEAHAWPTIAERYLQLLQRLAKDSPVSPPTNQSTGTP